MNLPRQAAPVQRNDLMQGKANPSGLQPSLTGTCLTCLAQGMATGNTEAQAMKACTRLGSCP